MRHNLKAIVGETREFCAIVSNFGVCEDSPQKQTILLKSLRFATDYPVIEDHVWIQISSAPELKKFNRIGETIKFTAKVIAYKKQYRGDKLLAQDYQLSAIRSVESIN